MSDLYLYALLERRPAGTVGRTRVIRCGRLFAAVSDVVTPPAITARSLRAHDAVVRRLATLVDAVLPVRFGTVVSNPTELARSIAPREKELRDALRLVRGREQMTLRVYAAHGAGTGDERCDDAAERNTGDAGGAGTRHLRRLHRAHLRRTSVPEIAAVRDAFAPFVRAERVERHDVPERSRRSATLIASVHHLIDRRAARRYRAAVKRAGTGGDPVRIVVKGPWPPYAFAPDAVA